MRQADKRTLYVGGLADDVDQAALHAAFIPFGDLVEVNMPMDNQSGKHRGFGFVEFENAADATEATFNMHNSELFGRVLSVNAAKPSAQSGHQRQAIWHADADTYFDAAGEKDEDVPDDGLQPEPGAQDKFF